MNFHRFPSPSSLAAALLCLSAATAGAVGFRLPNQDPEGIARGNAFAATADNPSAIYYNPAGITQLEGHQLSIGGYFISADIHYMSATGITDSTDATPQLVPQIYYTYSPKDSPVSFGLGVYAPYGLGIDYGKTGPVSSIAQEANLLYATVNPVIAYQITPELSLAAGLTLNYSDITLKRAIGFNPGDGLLLEADGFDVGFNLGLRYQPSEHWAFGLNYRSPTQIDYEGDSSVFPYDGGIKARTRASIDYPMFIVGGVSYRPDDKWNFEYNLDWTDFDSVNETTILGVFGGPQVFPFNYKSSFMHNFGVTRQLGGGYFASVGYIYSENSVPDRTFSPFNPDSDLHLGSLGFGHRGDTFSWAVGYHFAFNDGRKVTGSLSPSMIGQTADGTYETFNNALNISCRYSF